MLGKSAKVHNQNFCVNVIVQNLRCNLGKKKSVPKLLTWSELQQCCSEVGNICPPSCQISDGNHFIWYYLQSSLLFPCDFACCFGSPQHISQSGVTVIYTAEQKNPLYVRMEKTEKAVARRVIQGVFIKLHCLAFLSFSFASCISLQCHFSQWCLKVLIYFFLHLIL